MEIPLLPGLCVRRLAVRVARAAGGFKFVRSAMGCDEHIRGFLDFAKKAQP